MTPTDIDPPEDHERHLSLSDDQVERLADILAPKVAAILKKDLFADIGRTVVEKALYIIGVGVLMLAAWLAGKGFLK